MNITRGVIKKALRVGIYGTEGVGKTTFAAQFPGAVFIDTEGSTNQMDVARFDAPMKWKDIEDCVDYVISNSKDFGTLVIDTVDWMEKLLFREVMEKEGATSIEGIPYGKGYVKAKEILQKLLEKLDKVIDKGVNVVLVCHSWVRKFELPDEMGSYDRYMLKLNEKNISPLIKEWVDLLLFVNYRTDVVEVDKNKKKGRGGQKRIMYSTHTACWDAKNRFGLPEEMPFEYEQIAHLISGRKKEVEEVHEVESVKQPVAETSEKKKASRKAPANVKVETVDKVPAKEEVAEEKNDRPESMISGEEEKNNALEKLWKLMKRDGIEDPMLIQNVVAQKEYYNVDVQIKDYDYEFITAVLLEAWDQVSVMAKHVKDELPF